MERLRKTFCGPWISISLFCLTVQVGAGLFHDMWHTGPFCSQHLCLYIQIVRALDEVKLLNPPDEPQSGYRLEVLYSCHEPATVQLDCTVSFDTGVISTLQLRRWSCIPGEPKISTLQLNLPDWLVYQADGIVPHSQWVLSCILRASVRYGGFGDTEQYIAAQDARALQPRPFYSRPVKQHRLCVSWSTQMLQLTQHFSTQQCTLEQGKMGVDHHPQKESTRQSILACQCGTTVAWIPTKTCLLFRNSPFAVYYICINWRKHWDHEITGSVQQWRSGAFTA